MGDPLSGGSSHATSRLDRSARTTSGAATASGLNTVLITPMKESFKVTTSLKGPHPAELPPRTRTAQMWCGGRPVPADKEDVNHVS
eukprot:8144212-Pyramimonas_sp.AAC.1